MSIFKKDSIPLDSGPPAHLSTELIKQIDTLTEEVEYLRFVVDKVDNPLGPASDDVFQMIKEEYVASGKKLPPGY